MSDDAMAAALALLADELDAVEVPTLVRAKCPRCRRWCLRSPYVLTVACWVCADTGEPFNLFDLMLMREFRLSWNAYQARLEKYGPPWVSPREWLTPRTRLATLSRPREDGEGVVHHA